MTPSNLENTLSFHDGLKSPLKALSFILKRPSLFRYFLYPLCITFIFFAILGWGYFHLSEWLGLQFSEWVEQSSSDTSDSPGWIKSTLLWFYSWSGWLGWTLAWVIFAVFSYFTFTLVGSVICSPFNDILAYKVLKARGFENIVEEPFIKSASRAIFETSLLSILKVFIFLIALIPGLNIISLIALPFIVAYDHYDFPWSYVKPGLFNKFSVFKRDFKPCMGFAIIYAPLLMIPFFAVLLIPLGVVAASLTVPKPESALPPSEEPPASTS